MKIYKIRDWAALFENNRSRTVIELSWVPIPNRHDGENFSKIVAHPQGAEIFAAWILLLQVASRCQPRGSLLRDNRQPHDSQSLALKTRAPVKWFDLALEFLEKETDWLEISTDCHRPDTVPPVHCQSPDVKVLLNEGNGIERTEQKEQKEWVGVFSEIEKRLGLMFKRTGPVTEYAEQSGISEISRRPGSLKELNEIETFFNRPNNYFPKSLSSLVTKWQETLDRARLYSPSGQRPVELKSTPPPALKGKEQDAATLKRFGDQVAAQRKIL